MAKKPTAAQSTSKKSTESKKQQTLPQTESSTASMQSASTTESQNTVNNTEEQTMTTAATIENENETSNEQNTSDDAPNGVTTFSLVKVNKFGTGLYRIAGMRGTVEIRKSLVDGAFPQSISISGAKFVTPETQAAALTPEKRTKLEEKRAKLEERAKKQSERLAKLNAKLGIVASATAASSEQPAI